MKPAPLPSLSIKAIIGLGNPGSKYHKHRHNIGFLILDALAERHGGSWQHKDNADIAQVMINDQRVLLIKPQTFMNDSGKVIPALSKQGIKAENILVVHDELEKPFGDLSIRIGGSAKGHNGLRSIIGTCGMDFPRLRFGIGRPTQREDVPDYVLSNFAENSAELEQRIGQAVDMLEKLFVSSAQN
jgi:peptidyl-tRNA hydrolase, PTH1 family